MRLSRSSSEKETCTKEIFLVKISFCTKLIFSLVKHFFILFLNTRTLKQLSSYKIPIDLRQGRSADS